MSSFASQAQISVMVEIYNGVKEAPRGIGPQSGWLEKGPIKWAKDHVPQMIDCGVHEIIWKDPGGCETYRDGIPVFTIDQLAACGASDNQQVQRIHREFAEMVDMVRASGVRRQHIYLGRLRHLERHPILSSSVGESEDPRWWEMLGAITSLAGYFNLSGVGDHVMFWLDNQINRESSEEDAVLQLLPLFVNVGIEPVPSNNSPHLCHFQAMIAADYAVSSGLLNDQNNYFRSPGRTPIVLGRLGPSASIKDVAIDSWHWTRHGCGYAAQWHLLFQLPKEPYIGYVHQLPDYGKAYIPVGTEPAKASNIPHVTVESKAASQPQKVKE